MRKVFSGDKNCGFESSAMLQVLPRLIEASFDEKGNPKMDLEAFLNKNSEEFLEKMLGEQQKTFDEEAKK